MTPQGSALQEAFEEAGVDGDVDEIPIGKFEVEKKWGGICTITVYSMKVTKIYDHWMEDDFRTRRWMSPAEAIENAHKKDTKDIIRRFVENYKSSSLD